LAFNEVMSYDLMSNSQFLWYLVSKIMSLLIEKNDHSSEFT